MEVDLTDSSPAVPDRRRRQWIPLSASFPFDTTGTRLLEEFGNDGIALWVAFLTACKRSPIQGRISYGSEAEGWAQLGLDQIGRAASRETVEDGTKALSNEDISPPRGTTQRFII